jgi:hypothetical protein
MLPFASISSKSFWTLGEPGPDSISQQGAISARFDIICHLGRAEKKFTYDDWAGHLVETHGD